MSSTPIEQRRGYALTDLSNASIAYIMVRGPVAQVAQKIAEISGNEAIQETIGKPLTDGADSASGHIVYQLVGHPWSIFAGSYNTFEDLPQRLSNDFGFEVIAFCNEDVSGWSALVVYQKGKEMERIEWGLDYSDEMEDAAEYLAEIGEEVPDRKDQYARWDVHTTIVTDEELEMSDEYRFRSKLRKISEDDLKRGEAFVSELLVKHDAYLSDLEEMVWCEDKNNKVVSQKLPPDAIAGVYSVPDTSSAY